MFEKMGQKGIFRNFLENFDQKKRLFFWRALPLKNNFGAKGAFRKILSSFSRKLIFQNSTKGGIFGSAGGRIPGGGGGGRPPPPLNPLLKWTILERTVKVY